MFRFEYTSYLLGLWIIPVLIIVYIIYWKYRTRQAAQLGEEGLLNRLIIGLSPYRQHLRIALLLTGILALLLALANPQWGNKKEKVIFPSLLFV